MENATLNGTTPTSSTTAISWSNKLFPNLQNPIFCRSCFNKKTGFFKDTPNGNEFENIVLDYFWKLCQSEESSGISNVTKWHAFKRAKDRIFWILKENCYHQDISVISDSYFFLIIYVPSTVKVLLTISLLCSYLLLPLHFHNS